MPPEQARIIDSVCDRFEAAWCGVRPQIADYLAGVDPCLHAVLSRELIQLDIFYRQKAGEQPDRAEYQPWLSTDPSGGTDLSFDTTEGAGGAHASTAHRSPADKSDDTGTRANTIIGEYEVLEEIARGGMGVVYRARQVALKRIVALKMIRSDLGADPGRLARFQTEAHAVARLSHPNIVQIYEVGRHERQPFLSLEFMDGGSLQHRLAGTPLPYREAAELVKTLAAATHYAHSKGIVHRDLKPANILLQSVAVRNKRTARKDCASSPFDEFGPPTPEQTSVTADYCSKIADFGLAKQLGAESGQTCTGASLGTPSYMAPEQAEGHAENVGPLSDVYGLGAVLYECLTGRPPFKAATPLETVRQVTSLDPVPPSRLQPQVSRDLELICLHCLEKEPRKRYASAAALEEDLRRFLDGRPIQARATPAWERAWKWARRRPLAAASSLAAAASLLCIVIVWAIFTIRLGEARRLAENNASEREQQRILAEQNRDKTLQVVDRFLTRVGETKLADNPELSELRKDLLADALEFSKSFLNQKENPDPLIRQEAAHAAQRTYRIYNMMGLRKEQHEDTELAVGLFRKLVAEFPENPGYRYDLSSSLNALGVWYTGNGKAADAATLAEGYLLEAKALRAALSNQYPDKPEYRAALARTYSSLANLYRRLGTRPQDVQQNYQTSLDILHDVLKEHPSRENRIEVAVLDNRIANYYYTVGRLEEMEARWVEAIELYEANLQERPNDRSTRENLADSCQYLGVAYTDLGKVDRARVVTLRALAILQQLVRESPRHPGMRNSLAMCFNNLSRVHRKASQPKEELAALENSLRLFEELVSEWPLEVSFRYNLGKVSTNVGVALLSFDRVDDAIKTCSRAMQVLEPMAKAHPQELKYTYELARTCRLMGEAQALSETKQSTKSHSDDWIGRTITLLDALPTHTAASPEARTLLAESLVAHAVVDLQQSKTEQALAELNRAEKLGFADTAWLKTVRTLGQTRVIQGPSSLESIKQLDLPAYLSGPPERLLFLALIYCHLGELLKVKSPELAEKANRRAAELMGEYLARGKSLPSADRKQWPRAMRNEPQLRPFYFVIDSPAYASLSSRAIGARNSSLPERQTVGDGRGPRK